MGQEEKTTNVKKLEGTYVKVHTKFLVRCSPLILLHLLDILMGFFSKIAFPDLTNAYFALLRHAGHMYSLVCQDILLAPGDREVAGLFHSLDKDEGEDDSSTMDISLIKTLVSKCATSSDLNMREAAAVDLLDVLTEDEDEETGLATLT